MQIKDSEEMELKTSKTIHSLMVLIGKTYELRLLLIFLLWVLQHPTKTLIHLKKKSHFSLRNNNLIIISKNSENQRRIWTSLVTLTKLMLKLRNESMLMLWKNSTLLLARFKNRKNSRKDPNLRMNSAQMILLQNLHQVRQSQQFLITQTLIPQIIHLTLQQLSWVIDQILQVFQRQMKTPNQ